MESRAVLKEVEAAVISNPEGTRGKSMLTI